MKIITKEVINKQNKREIMSKKNNDNINNKNKDKYLKNTISVCSEKERNKIIEDIFNDNNVKK